MVTSNNMKNIHFIWLDSPLPDWAKWNIAEFSRLNPDRDVKLHITSDGLLDEYRPIYETLEIPSQKSDLLRYSIMERQGGWYFDTDFWPKVGVEKLEKEYDFTEDTFFLTEFPNPRNPVAAAVIYSKPHHPYWGVIKERVLKTKNTNINSYGPNVLRDLNHNKTVKFTLGKMEQFYTDDSEWFVHGYKEKGL